MKIICIRGCFWQDRYWKPGMTTVVAEGSEFPHHFEAVPAPAPAPAQDAKTKAKAKDAAPAPAPAQDSDGK